MRSILLLFFSLTLMLVSFIFITILSRLAPFAKKMFSKTHTLRIRRDSNSFRFRQNSTNSFTVILPSRLVSISLIRRAHRSGLSNERPRRGCKRDTPSVNSVLARGFNTIIRITSLLVSIMS